jgi:hypothetical protein
MTPGYAVSRHVSGALQTVLCERYGVFEVCRIIRTLWLSGALDSRRAVNWQRAESRERRAESGERRAEGALTSVRASRPEGRHARS